MTSACLDIAWLNPPVEIEAMLCTHEGAFNQSIIAELGFHLRQSLAHEPSIKRQRTIFSAFIEMAHNILHYTEPAFGKIMIFKENKTYHLISINPVSSEKARFLEARLQCLASLPRETLQARYLQQLHQDPDPNSHGAGLGLFTLARLSPHPLQYHLTPFNAPENPNLHFCLHVMV